MNFEKIIIVAGLFILSNLARGQYFGGDVTIDSVDNRCPGFSTVEMHLRIFTGGDIMDLDTIIVATGDGGSKAVVRSELDSVGYNTFVHEYHLQHVYSGCGVFWPDYTDTTQIFEGINLIDNKVFFLQSAFLLDRNQNEPKGVQFRDYPIVNATRNRQFRYNPIAIDDDGDSTRYQVAAWASNPNYNIPAGVALNPISGELVFDIPDSVGQYRILIEVQDFRDGLLMGSNVKPLTINVLDHNPAFRFKDTASWNKNADGAFEYILKENESFQLSFRYSDTLADSTNLIADGEPFYHGNPPVFISSVLQRELIGSFSWLTDTTQGRSQPYIVNFIGYSRYDTLEYYSYLTVVFYVEDNWINNAIYENSDCSLEILPNPANDLITINTNCLDWIDEIDLYNTRGDLVFSAKGSCRSSLDVSRLGSGLYLLQLRDKRGNFLKKKILVYRD